MAAKPLKKGATYEDLRRVPEHFVAEMFDGELYASPRPAIPHARAAGALLARLREAIDRGQKLRIYARESVAHAWLVDPLEKTLAVLALESGTYTSLDERHGNAKIRAEPFAALELDLRSLWIS